MEMLKITKNMEKDIYFSSLETDSVGISKTEKSPEKVFISGLTELLKKVIGKTDNSFEQIYTNKLKIKGKQNKSKITNIYPFPKPKIIFKLIKL